MSADEKLAQDKSAVPLFTPTRASLAAAALVFAFALYQAVATNNEPDFFIYRFGAELGWLGKSPYDLELVRKAVRNQFFKVNLGPDDFQNNCGYFLPPAAGGF